MNTPHRFLLSFPLVYLLSMSVSASPSASPFLLFSSFRYRSVPFDACGDEKDKMGETGGKKQVTTFLLFRLIFLLFLSFFSSLSAFVFSLCASRVIVLLHGAVLHFFFATQQNANTATKQETKTGNYNAIAEMGKICRNGTVSKSSSFFSLSFSLSRSFSLSVTPWSRLQHLRLLSMRKENESDVVACAATYSSRAVEDR